MELFYIPRGTLADETASLRIEGDEFHHIARVLRKKTGDRLRVTDGTGRVAEIEVVGLAKRWLEGEVLSRSVVPRPSTRVTVALSMLKAPARFDMFLEKATELGVGGIIPMISHRTVSQPSGEKLAGKLQRWNNIILSAARQSKCFHLPELIGPLPFRSVLALEGYDNRLMPYEESSEAPRVNYSGKNTLFLIGGEGGFTGEEAEEARASGFTTLSLGRSILRAETAALFAAAMVRSQLLVEDAGEWL
ncbi:MAG TPA: 16S rRNA (uracil(1498)-N(3))-methyltransferase [Chlorobium sp.]|uniref:Ribosomal RNA small subunit methyltransferase E n=1 Tax=Chlorobium phaeovibrioides (strain DSM 265 / 1930) TaxID=290318 RepID=A4SCV6_CHLPM|nr:16S rRNA (uracil(1498)-N(3))-methyltransferase [Chlorobium sp.]